MMDYITRDRIWSPQDIQRTVPYDKEFSAIIRLHIKIVIDECIEIYITNWFVVLSHTKKKPRNCNTLVFVAYQLGTYWIYKTLFLIS